MSIRLIDAVWKHSRQRSGPLLVLLAIADHTNDNGVAWPAVSTLARKVRMSKRNVQRCIHTLVQNGELEVFRNRGIRSSNLYKIRLGMIESVNDDTQDAINDAAVVKPLTPQSSSSVVGVAQSVSESKIESTPIVPKGDEEKFWTQVCFECFNQPIRSLPLHVRRAVILALPSLKKEHSNSLLKFYESLEARKPPYSSRRHSPERLMLDLPRQLALAIQEFPPTAEPDFTIEDVWDYLTKKHGNWPLPRSLHELEYSLVFEPVRKEVHQAMRERKKENPTKPQ